MHTLTPLSAQNACGSDLEPQLAEAGGGERKREGEIGPEFVLIEGKWETDWNHSYPLALFSLSHTHAFTPAECLLHVSYSDEISPCWPTACCRSILCDYGLQPLEADMH